MSKKVGGWVGGGWKKCLTKLKKKKCGWLNWKIDEKLWKHTYIREIIDSNWSWNIIENTPFNLKT